MRFLSKQFVWRGLVPPKRNVAHAKFIRIVPGPNATKSYSIDIRYPNTVVLARMPSTSSSQTTKIFHSNKAWSDPYVTPSLWNATGYKKRYDAPFDIYRKQRDLSFLEGVPVCRRFLAGQRTKIEKAIHAKLMLSKGE